MPRSVGDDKFSFGSRKITIRHIDGDALLTFGLQAVGQKREINFTLRHAAVFGARNSRKLIRENGFAVVKEPADECAFSVIHAAGGDEAKNPKVLPRARRAFNKMRLGRRNGSGVEIKHRHLNSY